MKRKGPPLEDEILEGKVLAILSYLGVLCIIPLVLKKNNPFILHHGKQGLVVFVAEVAVFILHIVFGQWFLKLGVFLTGVVSFIGIISILQGKYSKLPVIYEVSQKITL